MELESNIKSKSEIAGTIATIFVAFVILSVSVLRSATPRIAYFPTVLSEKVDTTKPEKIDYLLAYQGKIGPDNTFWYVKVLRDKAWYLLTFDAEKKSELNLLFADKRLNSALELFKENKPDLGFATLTKAEKYLEMAIPDNNEGDEYLKKLALASLKHREVIENEIMPLSPEDIRPNVIRINDYPKEVYKKTRDLMQSKGLIAPENVFELK
jgi:hypothetical protein